MAFERFDKVMVRGVGLDSEALQRYTVARVLKSFVELDDGSKFTHGGAVYPRQDYSTRRLLALTPELEAKHRRQKLIRYLKTRKWDSFDTDSLAEIAAALKTAKVLGPGAEGENG